MKSNMLVRIAAITAGAAMRMAAPAAAILIAASGCAASAALYVSPDGNDADPGSRAKPFATLEAARNAIRQTKASGTMPVAGFTVYLRGGVCRLKRTFELGPQDSGRPGAPIVYRAFEDEEPILSGGRRITGWQGDADGRWKASAAGVDNTRQLYVNGVRARRARGGGPPGANHYGGDVPLAGLAGYTTTDADMAKWRNQSDTEFGYFAPVWSHMILKVDHIRPDGKGGAIVNMQQPWFWMASTSGYIGSIGTKPPDYMENAFELLDEPGEWYLDRPARMIYYIPNAAEDMAAATVVAPQLEKLVEVSGTLDDPVHDVSFEGITFAEATWLRPSRIGHLSVQSNFVMRMDNIVDNASRHGEWLRSPANIVVDAARAIRFERCTFTRLGGAGIDLQHGARDNVISGCEFHDVSGTAIQVGDVQPADHHPDDERLIVKDNRVVNNHIHHTGVEYRGSVGVFVGYTDGTVIAHNEISHLPYAGVSVGWGWGNTDAGGYQNRTTPWTVYQTPTTSRNNRIEYNHIHHILQHRGDGGAVYTLGSQPGTVIRGNHIHDNRRYFGGVHLDNGSRHVEVTGNLIYRVHRAVQHTDRAAEAVATHNIHDNHFVEATPTIARKPGKVGLASGGPIDVPHSPKLDPEHLTAEAWVYLTDFPSTGDPRRWIVGKNGNETVPHHYALVIWKRKVSAYLAMPSLYQATSEKDVVTFNRWHHMAMTYDGSILRLYFDGEPAGATKVDKKRLPGTGTLAIGKRPDGDAQFFLDEGRIDEVRVYGRALSADEIRSHFKAPQSVPANDNGLAGYWSFDKKQNPPEMDRAIEDIIEKAGPEPLYRKRPRGRQE